MGNVASIGIKLRWVVSAVLQLLANMTAQPGHFGNTSPQQGDPYHWYNKNQISPLSSSTRRSRWSGSILVIYAR
jgi:hypothetical protein